MIARILDKLADTHPRAALALLFTMIFAFCVVVGGVFVVAVAAAASFIYSLGA
jgi:hypothetical protein